MKIYISGKITGTTDYMERFAAVEDRLTEQGHSVINPARVNGCLPPDTTYEQYMDMCFCMLKQAEAIYMMQGWRNSPGACREFGFAMWTDMIIMEE